MFLNGIVRGEGSGAVSPYVLLFVDLLHTVLVHYTIYGHVLLYAGQKYCGVSKEGEEEREEEEEEGDSYLLS